MTEIVLPYDRANVRQETGYWCGPASIQTVLIAAGIGVAEHDIAAQTEALEGNVGWDDQDGTDSIAQIATVLNRYLGGYETRPMPNDPPTREQAERLWSDIVASVRAGRGVVVNIVAPPSNYPRGVKGSMSPAYGGGTVFHYMAVMGFDDEARAVWVADSGFRPYGYWMSFDQLATLIPPKGYTACVAAKGEENMPADIPVGLTPEVLAEAMGRSVALERYRQLFPAVVESLLAADCTTVDRAAMWLAQVGHESAGLKYMREIATGEEYEGRRDLGNTVPGDGVRFAGRGPIQITGRHNYAALSAWAAGRGFVASPTFFVDNPEALESDRYGFMGVTWYWTVARPMNSYADRADIEGATRAVNGGTNGLADRTTRWNRCRALGTAILPNGDDEMGWLEAQVENFKKRSLSWKDVLWFMDRNTSQTRDQLLGEDGPDGFQGWPILGRSKVDPKRNNTVVEAVAELRTDLAEIKRLLAERQS